MGIIRMSQVNLKLALTVAVRFSATRRQFGPKEDEEIPVLEYQMQVLRYSHKCIPYCCLCIIRLHRIWCFHFDNLSCVFIPLLQQWRLIPFLAAIYALEHFTKTFTMNFVEFQFGLKMKDKSERQVQIKLNKKVKSSILHTNYI